LGSARLFLHHSSVWSGCLIPYLIVFVLEI